MIIWKSCANFSFYWILFFLMCYLHFDSYSEGLNVFFHFEYSAGSFRCLTWFVNIKSTISELIQAGVIGFGSTVAVCSTTTHCESEQAWLIPSGDNFITLSSAFKFKGNGFMLLPLVVWYYGEGSNITYVCINKHIRLKVFFQQDFHQKKPVFLRMWKLGIYYLEIGIQNSSFVHLINTFIQYLYFEAFVRNPGWL